MCFDDPDEHVNPLAMQVSRTGQHGVGFPHTGCSTEENGQSARRLAP